MQFSFQTFWLVANQLLLSCVDDVLKLVEIEFDTVSGKVTLCLFWEPDVKLKVVASEQ